jgi:hypothetical protein
MDCAPIPERSQAARPLCPKNALWIPQRPPQVRIPPPPLKTPVYERWVEEQEAAGRWFHPGG